MRHVFGDDRSFESTIWELDLESGVQRQLVDLPERDEFGPRWSPDGTALAFTTGVPGSQERDIFVATEDGRVVTRVTHDGDSGGPVWSPDGRWIAYQRGLDDPVAMVVRADGSEGFQLLAQGVDAQIRPVSWAPAPPA